MSRVYDKRSHRNLRDRLNRDVQAGHGYCTEIICTHPRGRWIPPGTPWHLAHHRASGQYLGPAHATCNTAEAGRYARHRSFASPTRRQPQWRSRRWVTPPC